MSGNKDRQIYAEKLVAKFKSHSQAPIVFEFSGSPKAGKTTVLNAVAAFFRRCGFRVEVVVERASICPIRDKRHFHFNVWTACTSLTQMIEKVQAKPKEDDPHIVILDRGMFDSVCWMRIMTKLSRLQEHQRKTIEDFLLLKEWRRRMGATIVMLAKPEDSMEREKGHLPVLQPDGKPVVGSIMNPEVLKLYRSVLMDTKEELESSFPIYAFDTSSQEFSGDVSGTCEAVADKLLSAIADSLNECILCIQKTKLFEGFESKEGWLDYSVAQQIEQRFSNDPYYQERESAEVDKNLVQALPVAIIRDSKGRVLRLRRKEKESSNTLNDKYVIWAGGHVNKEDGALGNPIKAGLIRELDEELRLKILENDLVLKGAVYAPNASKKGAQHIALVYEWIAPSENVAIVINAEEFAERRGNSQSGRFADINEILIEMQSSASRKKFSSESWSVAILENYLAPGEHIHDDLLSGIN